MSRTRQVLDQALDLKPEERADLAFEILHSLGPPAADCSGEEWIAEIERRARAALEGAPSYDWPDVRQEIEERLKSR